MPDILHGPGDEPLTSSASHDGSSSTGLAVPRWRRWLPWCLFAVVVLAIGTMLWLNRRPTDRLSRAALAQARAAWERQQIRDYEFILEIHTTGAAPATYHAVVEEGRLVQLELDGQPASPGAPATYTIDGLLDILEQELALQEGVTTGESAGMASIVRVHFDPQTGVPIRFLRMSPGSNRSTEWRIRGFRSGRPAATHPS